jgi:hypothetical protein
MLDGKRLAVRPTEQVGDLELVLGQIAFPTNSGWLHDISLAPRDPHKERGHLAGAPLVVAPVTATEAALLLGDQFDSTYGDRVQGAAEDHFHGQC